MLIISLLSCVEGPPSTGLDARVSALEGAELERRVEDLEASLSAVDARLTQAESTPRVEVWGYEDANVIYEDALGAAGADASGNADLVVSDCSAVLLDVATTMQSASGEDTATLRIFGNGDRTGVTAAVYLYVHDVFPADGVERGTSHASQVWLALDEGATSISFDNDSGSLAFDLRITQMGCISG